MSKWVRKIKVPASTEGQFWTVAQDAEGNWGCSCPVWKFSRKKCKHILFAQLGGGKQRPDYVLANVNRPKFDEDNNRLLIPLLRMPDKFPYMEASICYSLLKHGYTISDIRVLRYSLPREWTTQKIIEHVETHGEAIYRDPINHN